jgi:predicted CopG family antitoxin
MKTLNISISDLEYNKFGLKNEQLSFSELLEIVNKEMQKLNLRKSVELAEKYGLSKLTADEINDEIISVRKNAKNRH